MKAKRLAAILEYSSSILLMLAILQAAAYPQQKGTVEGRILNRTDPSFIARGIELDVIGLSGGMSILKSATTDSMGRFRIEGLPLNEPLMIQASYKGANYHTRFSFDAAGTAHAEIEVYEPTSSMAQIHVDGVQMAFQAVGDQLRSLETITFNNKTNPPRTYVNPEGVLRFSKSAGIAEIPRIRVTAPGASMPLVQSALESADGRSYYSLYPLRPGITTFEIQEVLPYTNRSYTYTKRFYRDIKSLNIGVIPKDMTLSGPGLSKIQTDPDKNFSVYTSSPIKAGTEVAWKFAGGTAAEEPATSGIGGESTIEELPNTIGRNAVFIGSLLLAGFVLVLWYAFNHDPVLSRNVAGLRMRRLRDAREEALRQVGDLDRRYEANELNRQDFLRLRENGKRRLLRIYLLMKKR